RSTQLEVHDHGRGRRDYHFRIRGDSHMASAMSTRNAVFRSIEDKWRGPLPCSWSELSAGVLLGLVVAVASNAVVGGLSGLVLVVLLVVWRRLDHDRSDYAQVFLRRRFIFERAYNANEPDTSFVPFDPR